ncbi:MAG: SET domain-containing protein-lysine N-methyltransferase [Thermoguttaceae bacterium]|nr:SET domain-containing protein-lysine N-methyltransferase [Thermoguttaceae bacterium]
MAECVYPLEIDNLELDTVIIGDTPYGKGVFASQKIKSGMPIGKIEGEFHPDKKYDSEYCMSFNDGALEPEEPYRFVNHSCDPNCELVELVVADQNSGKVFHELWIYALKDIKEGQQLTLDYAWPYTDAIECQCGSPKCRGWIVAADEVAKIVAKKGLGSLAAKENPDDSTPVKKTRKKAVKKASVKKATVKKTVAKKTESAPVKKTAKKTTVKKTVAKKTESAPAQKTAKKATVKKTTVKKTTAKKTVAKKSVAAKDSESATVKKTTAKKTVKKTASKKKTAK